MFDTKTLACLALLFPAWTGLPDAAAQEPLQRVPQLNRPSDPAIRTTYQLGPDDQILIHVADAPDITGKPQRLDPNGDLRLPMIGRVHAAGLTIEQLEAELTRRLKLYMHEPDVAITVTEFHSQPVSVIGAVGSSGVQQLQGPKTLIEMLSLAGGVSPDAGPIVRVARRVEAGRIPLPDVTEDMTGGFSIAEIDLRSLLEARNPDLNITLRPHDVISVPRAELVYIVGEVAKPGPVPLTGGTSLSVMEVVSSSGGVLRTAASSRARILRRTTDGQRRTEVNVDLKKIMQGKAVDVPLQAGDILIVPDSRGKRATTRALEAAVQAGIMIGTYGLIR